MLGGRASWGAALATLLVIGSGCAGGGHSSAKPSGVSAVRTTETDSRTAASTRAAAVSTTTTTAPPTIAAAPTAPGAAAPAAVTNRVNVAGTAPAAPAPPAPPSVTVVARTNGAGMLNDHGPCSNISATSVTRGELEVRRNAPAGALAVQYSVAGVSTDFRALPGVVTIRAGASSAVITVDPVFPNGPAPLHVHRSSPLTVTLRDGAAYDLGPASAATIALRFDLDLFGCSGAAP